MKKIIFSFLTLLAFFLLPKSVNAQPSSGEFQCIWITGTSSCEVQQSNISCEVGFVPDPTFCDQFQTSETCNGRTSQCINPSQPNNTCTPNGGVCRTGVCAHGEIEEPALSCPETSQLCCLSVLPPCGTTPGSQCVRDQCPSGNTVINEQCSNHEDVCCLAVNPPPTQDDPRCTVAGVRGINTAIGCIPFGDQNSFVSFVLRWAFGIGGGIALILIVYSGFLIMTSTGIPERLKAGQELMTSAISGLILLIFSVFVLRFIGVDILSIPGL